MQRTKYRCRVFNKIGLKPVCSAKSYLYRSKCSILFSDKKATGRMVSHNKEADQTVKTQNFPAGIKLKTFRLTLKIFLFPLTRPCFSGMGRWVGNLFFLAHLSRRLIGELIV